MRFICIVCFLSSSRFRLAAVDRRGQDFISSLRSLVGVNNRLDLRVVSAGFAEVRPGIPELPLQAGDNLGVLRIGVLILHFGRVGLQVV